MSDFNQAFRVSNVHNVEAEAELIGALLIDNELIEPIFEVVKADDFFEPTHQRIVHAILRLHERGRNATPVTLKPIFERDTSLAELGGVSYLAQLTAGGSGLLAPRQLAEQIAELSAVREIQMSAAMMAHDYMSGESSFEDAKGLVDEALAKVGDHSNIAPPLSAAGMLRKVKERSDDITAQALGADIGVKTHTVSDINAQLAPIEDGTYIVIGGRPSMGKTTLASSMAWGFAANGFPTYYAAAEGTETSLAMRLMADLSFNSELPIEHDAIRKDRLTAEQRRHYESLVEIAATLPIDYQMIGRCDIRRLRASVARQCVRWKERGDRLRVVVVDYMQLLNASENGREITDDRRRINAVSAGLLGIAKDFNLIVIALSQLSRSLEQRDDKRPRLSDLRESGRIEEDADAVLFVYREEYYLERTKPEPGGRDYDERYYEWQAELSRARNRVDIILAKNRHGEVRTRTAKFFGKYSAIRGGDFIEPSGIDELDFNKDQEGHP